CPPDFLISAAPAAASSIFIPCTITRAPSRANTRTIPSPMPLVEPVTRMTLSFSRMLCGRIAQTRTRAQSRLKHSLYDIPRVHLFEGFVPLSQRRDSIQNQIQIQLAARKQRNHLFPDRPVVRKTSLQRHSFLHQRIERKVQRLRPPTNFRDSSRGAH